MIWLLVIYLTLKRICMTFIFCFEFIVTLSIAIINMGSLNIIDDIDILTNQIVSSLNLLLFLNYLSITMILCCINDAPSVEQRIYIIWLL